MNPDPPLVQVALPLPIDEPLTYLWPESAPSPPAVGLRVLVPLGKRRVTGYVVETNSLRSASTAAPGKSYTFKPVFSVLDDEPLFGSKELPARRGLRLFMVEMSGLEPPTPTLRTWCSPS